MDRNTKMARVLELANHALQQGEIPIAAIVFYGDQELAGHFTTERRDGRLLIHAELKALMEIDAQKHSINVKRDLQLFTNLEPCMMCLGAAISSFIGELCYASDAPSDGAVRWALETWDAYHVSSGFRLPKIEAGVLDRQSKALFKRYTDIHKEGPFVDWVRTLL